MVIPLQETVVNHTTLHRAAPSARPPTASPDHIAKELRHYDTHLRDVRGLAAGTRRHRVRIVDRFLHQKYTGRTVNISELRPDDVRGFLACQRSRCSAIVRPTR